jgi:uridine phosphorylase
MVFPQLKNKHLYNPMFTPKGYWEYRRKIGKYPKVKIPESVILCYGKRLLMHAVKNHKVREVDIGYGSKSFYIVNKTGNRVGMLGKFGIGSPAAVTALEELIALGVKNFISVGDAGALQRNLKFTDIVVCDRAIRDEGTSHHYMRNSKYSYPSKEMTDRIKAALKKHGIKYSVGTTWTIDAPYRETVREVRQYQKEGVMTVEMEASALFAVAKYRKAKIGSFFTISDSLAELDWKPNFHLTDKMYEVLYNVALESLSAAFDRRCNN